MDAAVVASVTTLALTIVKMVYDYWTAGRIHQWDIEQRQFDRKEKLRVAEELKIHTAKTAGVILTKIDENTVVNEKAIAAGEKAYTEANNLSMKIQQQGLQLREPHRKTDVEPT